MAWTKDMNENEEKIEVPEGLKLNAVRMVKTAYETALKYPAVLAVVEKTAPVAAKAVEVAGPYYVKAKEAATPYVAKATEVAGPYVTMVADKFTKKVPELD